MWLDWSTVSYTMGPIQTPLIQSLLTSLHQALSVGFSFFLWKEQLKLILNEIILSLKSCPAQNFQPLSPLGRQSIWDVLVAVVWRLKIFLPQRCLPPFSSPCQPSHPLNISLWSILQCITCCLWPNTFLALLYDTEPNSSSSGTFSDYFLPKFLVWLNERKLSAAFTFIILILLLLFIQRCSLPHVSLPAV